MEQVLSKCFFKDDDTLTNHVYFIIYLKVKKSHLTVFSSGPDSAALSTICYSTVILFYSHTVHCFTVTFSMLHAFINKIPTLFSVSLSAVRITNPCGSN